MMPFAALSLAALALGAQPAPAGAAPTPGPARAMPCDAEPLAHALDFWIGSWTVRSAGGRLEGTNRVEKTLRGCAVLEHWRDAEGGEGKSLFTFNPVTKRWNQVWVTENAGEPGGLKEKHLIARLAGVGTRFQGEIALPGGDVLLDRTTLTPEPGGAVRQLIEVSRDGGTTWRAAFDATYTREAARSDEP